MILATRWEAKGHTKEPQGEKKGVRALIDAETSISIIELDTKFGCVCREELVDKAEE